MDRSDSPTASLVASLEGECSSTHPKNILHDELSWRVVRRISAATSSRAQNDPDVGLPAGQRHISRRTLLAAGTAFAAATNAHAESTHQNATNEARMPNANSFGLTVRGWP